MNIFILSWIVQHCAEWHFDRHVIKMILETAQLLSTAHHCLNPSVASQWAEDKLIPSFPQCMPKQYQYHSIAVQCKGCQDETNVLEHPLDQRDDGNIQYVCSKCKTIQKTRIESKNADDAVVAYRNYYQGEEKRHLAVWKHREKPEWFANF